LIVAGLLAAICATAQAEVVQEFNYQLKDVKPYGGFTVVFGLRSYDTTGAPPPPLTTAVLRLPAGAKIRREFLNNKRFMCDVRKLNETKDPKTCRNAEIGRGRVLVDARPVVSETIPAKIYLFLAPGAVRGAVASIAILGIPDDSAPIVRDNLFIRETKVVVQANFFDDPSPDGLFGYKLVLPTGPIRGVNISIAEVNVTVSGLTLTKRQRKCAKRSHGRCAKRKLVTKKLFWVAVPKCPRSGKFTFQAVFGYAALPTTARTIELSCPRFKG
jgi:hypothetical protein